MQLITHGATNTSRFKGGFDKIIRLNKKKIFMINTVCLDEKYSTIKLLIKKKAKMQKIVDLTSLFDTNSAVIMSYDEYSSMKETMYLLSSETNRDRLSDAVEQIENLKFTTKEI